MGNRLTKSQSYFLGFYSWVRLFFSIGKKTQDNLKGLFHIKHIINRYAKGKFWFMEIWTVQLSYM